MIQLLRTAAPALLTLLCACAAPEGQMPANDPTGLDRDYTVYVLEHADATQVSNTLNDLINDAATVPGAESETASIFLEVDTESNSVMYRASKERGLQIRALLDNLDRPAK